MPLFDYNYIEECQQSERVNSNVGIQLRELTLRLKFSYIFYNSTQLRMHLNIICLT